MPLLDQLRKGQGTSEHLDALRRYDGVMDNEMARFTERADDVAQMQAGFNALYRNHLLEKSSLYDRLLKGAKPLILPPPVSHSYPWYEAVESSEPIGIMEPADAAEWSEKDSGSERMLIHQSFWDVLEQQDETTFLITYGNWHQLGFTWKLWRENLPAEQATASLCCHHSQEKRFLVNEDDLRQEAEYFTNRWKAGLADALAAAAPADAPPLMGTGLFIDRGAYEQLVRQREHKRAVDELKSRKEAGLPEMPTDEEMALKTQENMTSRLGDDWFIRNGLLYHRSWRLQRISPVALDESHYLDL
ncbi:TPA: hypothetical protein L4559_003496 [Pseudomonas aeruginosa]|nr:hypothetical protein [Pseudomonas aeruginosa]